MVSSHAFCSGSGSRKWQFHSGGFRPYQTAPPFVAVLLSDGQPLLLLLPLPVITVSGLFQSVPPALRLIMASCCYSSPGCFPLPHLVKTFGVLAFPSPIKHTSVLIFLYLNA